MIKVYAYEGNILNVNALQAMDLWLFMQKMRH